MTSLTLPKNIDPSAFLMALEKEACERSLVEFVRRAWHVLEPGAPYIHGWHIGYLCEHLEAITFGEKVDGRPYNRLLANVPPGCMKALDINTPILTTWGWKKHGDLCPGDFVFGPDGQPKRVVAVTPHALEPAYRVSFDDRESIVAGGGHLWEVEREVALGPRWREKRVVTTPELRFSKRADGGRGPDRIPVARGVSLPPKRLLIDPYLLGAWLGDGGADAGSVYAAEQDVRHFEQLGRIGTTVPAGGSRTQAFHRVTVEGLSTRLRILGLLGNKHIPEDYLEASAEQRLALLQGLLDTDGHCDKKGGPSFTNSNENLALGVAHLVASLGMKAFVTERFTELNGVSYGPHYKVTFNPPPGTELFRLQRKQNRLRCTVNARTQSRYVTGVDGVGLRLVNCIQVEGSMYLAGRAFIPTHNSMLVSVFWPAWEWGPRNMPWLRIIAVSHKLEGVADRDSLRMRRLITSDWYRALWGDRVILTSDQNQRNRYENTAGGWRHATASGAVTGLRGDRVIVDDPHSVDGANSDAERSSVVQWFREAVPTRLTNPRKSAIIVIMQRLHEADVSGFILEGAKPGALVDFGYDYIMLPMRFDPERRCITKLGIADPRTEPGELLFPERFPGWVVDRDERILGPYAVAGQFQQTPTPRGGGIIQDSWWQLWTPPEYPPMDFIVASLDSAYTEKQENDPSALTIWGVWSGGLEGGATRTVDRYGRAKDAPESARSGMLDAIPKLMLMNAWADRLGLHDLVNRVAKDCRRFKVDRLLVENKASGISVASEIRRIYAHEDWAVHLIDPKSQDKIARLYSVQPIFSEGQVWAPDKSWAEEVIRQCASVPKCKHDDLCDTTSQALKHLREMGLLTRSAERLAEIDRDTAYANVRQPKPLYSV